MNKQGTTAAILSLALVGVMTSTCVNSVELEPMELEQVELQEKDLKARSAVGQNKVKSKQQYFTASNKKAETILELSYSELTNVANNPGHLEAHIHFLSDSGYAGGRLGLGFANGDELSTTFSAFGYLQTNSVVNLYGGLGLLASSRTFGDCTDTFDWTHTDNDQDSGFDDGHDCEEDGNIALYPELGLRLNMGQVAITPFVRHYWSTDDYNNGSTAVGISVGWSM